MQARWPHCTKRRTGPIPAGAAVQKHRRSTGFALLASRDRSEESYSTRRARWSRSSAGGEVEGYLRQGWGPLNGFGCEVAALGPEAVLSLAAYHSGLRGPLDGRDDTITWQLPPVSLTSELLGDYVPVTIGSAHRPAEGWMAAVVDTAKLTERLVALWSRSSPAESGFSVRVGEVFHSVGRARREGPELVLDEATLVQLLFGYRQPGWAGCGPGVLSLSSPPSKLYLRTGPGSPQSMGGRSAPPMCARRPTLGRSGVGRGVR